MRPISPISTGRSGGTVARGILAFTLLEILIVVTILSFLMAIGLPRMRGTYRNSQLRVSARDIVSLLKYARAEAITRREWVEVRLDLDRHEYQLDLMLEGVRLPERERADLPITREEAPRALPEMVQFTAAVTYDDRIQEEDDAIVILRFYPRGTASGATIVLQTAGTEPEFTAYLTLELFSTTGTVEVLPGKPREQDIEQIEVDGAYRAH